MLTPHLPILKARLRQQCSRERDMFVEAKDVIGRDLISDRTAF